MHFDRRQALGSLAAGLTAGSLLTGRTVQPAAAATPDGVCVLWPQLDEGPYYFDPHLVRSDIAEGRPGAPLKLTLKVLELGSCKPLANARVDIWHADARGIYSGYASQGDKRDISTAGQKYLRGTQATDADGAVVFNTIYPGWYPGRTPHIHVKAFLESKMVVTGQAFFPDDFSAKIYRGTAPYSARPTPDTNNATDGIYQTGEKDGGGTVLALADEGGVIQARLTIAVDRSGEAARKAEGWAQYLWSLLGR
jgi:protocatechuate 3,4-dioxygenase beta subunit